MAAIMRMANVDQARIKEEQRILAEKNREIDNGKASTSQWNAKGVDTSVKFK